MKENPNETLLSELDCVRLSQHFKLSEFLNLRKYPENIPTMQAVANLTYGCHLLLEPARLIAGPIIINSGFRCESVNKAVGGVRNSQHLKGQAADVRTQDPARFKLLVDFLKSCSIPTSCSPALAGFTSLGIRSLRQDTTSGQDTTNSVTPESLYPNTKHPLVS